MPRTRFQARVDITLHAFVAKCIKFDRLAAVRKNFVRREYKRWCNHHKVPIVNSKLLTSFLCSRGAQITSQCYQGITCSVQEYSTKEGT
jgi:hypothetical protein